MPTTPQTSATPQPGYSPNETGWGEGSSNPEWSKTLAEYLAASWANGWRGLPGGWSNSKYGKPNKDDTNGVWSPQTILAFSQYAADYKPGKSGWIDSNMPYVAPGPNDYIEDPITTSARIAAENLDRQLQIQFQRLGFDYAQLDETIKENARRNMLDKFDAELDRYALESDLYSKDQLNQIRLYETDAAVFQTMEDIKARNFATEAGMYQSGQAEQGQNIRHAGSLSAQLQQLYDDRTNNAIQLSADPGNFIEREYAVRALNAPEGTNVPGYTNVDTLGEAIRKLLDWENEMEMPTAPEAGVAPEAPELGMGAPEAPEMGEVGPIETSRPPMEGPQGPIDPSTGMSNINLQPGMNETVTPPGAGIAYERFDPRFNVYVLRNGQWVPLQPGESTKGGETIRIETPPDYDPATNALGGTPSGGIANAGLTAGSNSVQVPEGTGIAYERFDPRFQVYVNRNGQRVRLRPGEVAPGGEYIEIITPDDYGPVPTQPQATPQQPIEYTEPDITPTTHPEDPISQQPVQEPQEPMQEGKSDPSDPTTWAYGTKDRFKSLPGDRGTGAKKMIVGDPQRNGRPNPELVEVTGKNVRTKVTPLRDAMTGQNRSQQPNMMGARQVASRMPNMVQRTQGFAGRTPVASSRPGMQRARPIPTRQAPQRPTYRNFLAGRRPMGIARFAGGSMEDPTGGMGGGMGGGMPMGGGGMPQGQPMQDQPMQPGMDEQLMEKPMDGLIELLQQVPEEMLDQLPPDIFEMPVEEAMMIIEDMLASQGGMGGAPQAGGPQGAPPPPPAAGGMPGAPAPSGAPAPQQPQAFPHGTKPQGNRGGVPRYGRGTRAYAGGTAPNVDLPSYDDSAYQNLPSLQYLQGGQSQSDYNTLKTGNAPGAFGTKIPESGSINYGRYLDIERDPVAHAMLDSIYRSGSRNLAAEVARAKHRAPLGQAVQTSLVRT